MKILLLILAMFGFLLMCLLIDVIFQHLKWTITERYRYKRRFDLYKVHK